MPQSMPFSARRPTARTAMGTLVLAALCACSSVASRKTAPQPPPPLPPQDSMTLAPLLDMMSELPKNDPARQAETFQQAKDEAESSPTSSNRLKYALLLATPGAGSSDPVAAQRQLSELLDRPDTLLPVERLLASVELQEVDQRLILQAENKRLRDEAPPDDRDKLQATSRRLAAESDENAKLRKALDEARAKLEAVTHIERSITNRGNTGTRNP